MPKDPYTVPLGKARVVREGKDLTVVATSWMNVEAYKAAEILEKKYGVSLEIIDPRTIYPLDQEAIINSVKKTGHLIVADYDWEFCGFSAEVAALVSEKLFGKLHSPVTRLAFARAHCATTRPLENAFYPNARTITREVFKMLDREIPNVEVPALINNFKGPF